MRRSSARRGQVEPIPALVAVAILGSALSAYAVAFGAALPAADHGSDRARPALDRATATLRVDGVVRPRRISRAAATLPATANVTVRAGGRAWHAGPVPPANASVASRPVPVRVASGRILPGRVRVEVWP
jgi:hypothetical protein